MTNLRLIARPSLRFFFLTIRKFHNYVQSYCKMHFFFLATVTYTFIGIRMNTHSCWHWGLTFSLSLIGKSIYLIEHFKTIQTISSSLRRLLHYRYTAFVVLMTLEEHLRSCNTANVVCLNNYLKRPTSYCETPVS